MKLTVAYLIISNYLNNKKPVEVPNLDDNSNYNF